MTEQNQSGVNKIIAYFKQAYDELNKVTWPSKKQTQNYTAVVIALSVAVLIFFTVLDYIFETGIRQLILKF